MDKSKKVVFIIIGVFIIANLWTMRSMKTQIKNLQNDLNSMSSYLSNEFGNTSYQVSAMSNNLLSKLEKSESLLSSFESVVKYENESLHVTFKVVPKEKKTNEIIFLSLGTEKIEAISTNGSDYTAAFTLTTIPQKIIPTVSFESEAGIRQEILAEANVKELLSLNFESNWKNESNSTDRNDKILTFTIYAEDEKLSSLLKETPTATIIIKDSIATEVVRMDMEIVGIQPSSYSKDLNPISFEANLSEYKKNEGSYSVWIELKTKNGISYKDEIATFSYYGKDKSGTGTESSESSSVKGKLYPNFN